MAGRSIVLNFNLDGRIDTARAAKHRILEPHGRVPPNLMQVFSERAMKEIVGLNIETPWKSNTLISGQNRKTSLIATCIAT